MTNLYHIGVMKVEPCIIYRLLRLSTLCESYVVTCGYVNVTLKKEKRINNNVAM